MFKWISDGMKFLYCGGAFLLLVLFWILTGMKHDAVLIFGTMAIVPVFILLCIKY